MRMICFSGEGDILMSEEYVYESACELKWACRSMGVEDAGVVLAIGSNGGDISTDMVACKEMGARSHVSVPAPFIQVNVKEVNGLSRTNTGNACTRSMTSASPCHVSLPFAHNLRRKPRINPAS
jgi:hypothetical protein